MESNYFRKYNDLEKKSEIAMHYSLCVRLCQKQNFPFGLDMILDGHSECSM